MQLSTYILKTYFKTKGKNVQKIINEPYRCQEKCLHFLLRAAKHTAWGQEHQYNKLSSYEDFREKIPINTYQSLYPYIERSIKGERNVLWRGKQECFQNHQGQVAVKAKLSPLPLNH